MASHVFTPATGLVIRGKTRVSTMTPPGSPLGGAQRFPSRHRLRNRREFDAVFRQPSVRLRRGPLRLVARPNALGTARLGIVVAKRMIRRAVGRNRAKRVIRESFRLATGLPSMDIVVRVSQSEPAVCAPDADWLFAALARRAG